MLKAEIIECDEGQAILLPESLRTNRTEFYINASGSHFILAPVDDPGRPLRQVLGKFPEDFMEDRNQPMSYPEREPF